MNSTKKLKQTRFDQLAVGAEFRSNGNICVKRSSRTAHIIQYGRTFYYAKSEIVEVTEQ